MSDNLSDVISRLSEIIRNHPLEEKVFIVSTFVEGRQIGEYLTLQGCSWINLRYTTLQALAQETISWETAESGLRIIPETTQFFLMEFLFRALKEQGRNSYFTGLESETGIIRSLQKSISALRLEGLTSIDLSPEKFEEESKGRDLIWLMSRYEEELDKRKWIDLADVYRVALEKIPGSGNREDRLILCFQNRVLSGLPLRFLESYSGNRIIRLNRGLVFGLTPPRRYAIEPDPAAASEENPPLTAWLFSPEKSPSLKREETLDIFSATGAVNECREILRRIYGCRIPLDKVEILYPSGSVYPAHIQSLCRRSGLPVTFAEGFELSWTSPGKLFLGLLDWMENGYQIEDICRLIADRILSLRIDGEKLLSQSVLHILHKAGIGWGRERYLQGLDRFIGKEHPESEDIQTAEKLSRIFKKLFLLLPKFLSDSPAALPEFCQKMKKTLTAFTDVNSDLDEEALMRIQNKMDEVSQIDSESSNKAEIFEWMRYLISRIKVGASGPLPGNLHAASYFSGGFSGRQNIFACGLDQGRFPGTAREDPVLLDKECRHISDNLPLSTDRLRESLYDIAELLSSLQGNIILSFSSYDVIEERESFPSSLILQAFRLKNRDGTLNYSDLFEALSPVSGFIPSGGKDVLDSQEWWLARLENTGRLKDGEEAVRKFYPQLNSGLKANQKRRSGGLTEFEGKTGPLPEAFNPVNNPNLVLSASRLELLAECPFKYFLQYILKLEPPEDLEFDPSKWLDPMERGSLLHEIYCEFMTQLQKKEEIPDRSKHKALIREIAESFMQKKHQVFPPPSEAIYEKEKKEIIRSLDLFLKLESQREKAQPLFFEVPFGMSEIRGGPPPLKVSVGNKTLLLRGIIDRIDRIGENVYRVMDYKTGRFSKKYEELKEFGKGKILQHALYALAAQEILRYYGESESPEIKETGYFFPTEKGEGREFYIPAASPEIISEILKELIRWIEEGCFPAGPENYCDTCDYRNICGKEVQSAVKEKKKTDPESFEIFDNLEKYE